MAHLVKEEWKIGLRFQIWFVRTTLPEATKKMVMLMLMEPGKKKNEYIAWSESIVLLQSL